MGATIKGSTLEANDDDLYKISFNQLITHALNRKNYLLIADMHSDVNIAKTAISPETIKAMAKNGVKHLCLEIPDRLQETVDHYFAGNILYEQIEEAYKNFDTPWLNAKDNVVYGKLHTEVLKAAKENGIRVHYVDTDEPTPIAKEQPEMHALWQRMIPLTPQEENNEMAALQKTDPKIKTHYKAFEYVMLEQRYARDKVIAEKMQEMAKTGKVAMLYGRAHLTKLHGIHAFLGPTSTVIAMQTDFLEPTKFTTPSDNLPDYVFFIQPRGKDDPASAAAKLQPDNKRSAVCKQAVDATKPIYHLIACTIKDAALEQIELINNTPAASRRAIIPALQ